MFGWALVIQLTLILTWAYWDGIERPREKERLAYHDSMISGSAPSESRARVLIPWMAEFGARAINVLPGGAGSGVAAGRRYGTRAFHSSYMILNALGILLLLRYMWLLTASLYGQSLSMFATTLSACFLWFTFRDQYYHPWSLWEPGVFALGMYLIHTNSRWAFVALCVPAALLRETTAFLPFGFLIVDLLRKRRPSQAAIAGMAVWTAAFLAVRVGVGLESLPVDYFPYLWKRNTESFPYTLLVTSLFLGPLCLWLPRGIRRAPSLVKGFAISLACYAAFLISISFWWEIRYWATAIPVLVPLILEAMKTEFRGVAREIPTRTLSREDDLVMAGRD